MLHCCQMQKKKGWWKKTMCEAETLSLLALLLEYLVSILLIFSARMVGVRTHHKAFCLLCGFCTYLVRVHRWSDWGVVLRLPVHSLIDHFLIDLDESPGGVEVAGNGASRKRSQGHLLLLRHFDFVASHLR